MPEPSSPFRRVPSIVVLALCLAACGGDPAADGTPAAPPAGGGTPAVQPGAPATANTPDALRAHFASLHAMQVAGKSEEAGRALVAMLPDEARLRRALADDVAADKVEAVLGFYASLRARPMDKIADPANTEVVVHAATTAELAAYAPGGVAHAEFPRGASEVAKAGVLRAGTTFHEVELCKPGEDRGMKYDLFFHDGTSWSMLGPIWKALK